MNSRDYKAKRDMTPEKREEERLKLKYPDRSPYAPGRKPPEDISAGERLTSEEKATIMTLYHEGIGVFAIAKRIGRNHSVVSRFVMRYQSTVKIAHAYFESKAEYLAKRVVKHANVEESLEVLDRIDALSAKDHKRDQGAVQFNVVIGMPGTPAIPIPDIPVPALPPGPDSK